MDRVKAAFERVTVTLAIDDILKLRQVSEEQKQSAKYRRIAASIAEVGIIEPPVVARIREAAGQYLMLDGHVRLAILADMGEREVRCLVSDDDEGYTYNKRVARLATIQEHYMIVRAINRGVSEEKLAKALNVDIQSITRRRTLLQGICPEVAELLKDKSAPVPVFETLRRMKAPRQIEAAELMISVGNYSSSYAKALLAATREHDLVHPERGKKLGVAPEQIARMEREMETLQRDFKMIEATHGEDTMNLVVAAGYLAKLIENVEIARYLETNHPEFLTEFRNVINAVSLDEARGASWGPTE